MKSFSETRKADKSLVTGSGGGGGNKAAASIKEATPPQESTAEDKDTDSAGSPRNTSLLKKLGTRMRGGNKPDKKPATKK